MKDDRPPLFGSWPRMYTAVLAYLALLIALFTIFTGTFNR